MSADVAAVLAEAMYSAGMHPRFRLLGDEATHFANVGLAALTATGYACVYVPEGVAVAHGARLVYVNRRASWFAIEDTP